MSEKEWSRSYNFSEPVSAGPEEEHSAPDTGAEWRGSSEGKPSDEKIVASLAQAREELGRLRKTFESCDNIVSLTLANVAALERRCAALEKESQETAKSPEKDKSVERQIVALRESLGDQSPRETESSSSKEEELILVRPVKGVDKEGRLILGDPKLLRADAIKS